MKIEYRRKLPHKFYLGYTFFITWNLKGAIPASVLAQMRADRDDALRAVTDANYKQVDQVMKLINGATAVQANRILRRSGKFWAETYFDRYIRDEKHLVNTINYTIQNPVKAGICKDWQEYPFTYLDRETGKECGIYSADNV